MSDTVTLKLSKRKIYLAIGLIIIIAVVGVGGFFAYRYFTSSSLSITSFSTVSVPQASYYHSASDWVTSYDLNYKFDNQGGGAANSVQVVVALYDANGKVVSYSKDYGTVNSGMEVTDSQMISVLSTMKLVSPSTFKIFLYEGNNLMDQATLPYG